MKRIFPLFLFSLLPLCPLISLAQTSPKCDIGSLPSIMFRSDGSCLTSDAKALLTAVAAQMKQSPECRVVVTSYCGNSKSKMQTAWSRVNNVIRFLSECRGISFDRFIFSYGQEGGDCLAVDLRKAEKDEDGPFTVPAPHPNLKKLDNCVICDKKKATAPGRKP